MKKLGPRSAITAVALLLSACSADEATVFFNSSSGGGGSSSDGPIGGGDFQVIATDPSGGVIMESADGTVRSIAGTFQNDVAISAQHTWVLAAPVIFGDDAGASSPTLTIPAGVTFLARGGTPPSLLIIKRGAKIMATGTPDQPIIFTSAQPQGLRAPGDWGGIVINGRAPVNDLSPIGEGGSGPYGGNDPADNSGVLRYVRVEFAGRIFTSDDELNGIAFQGVGSGTTVEFVQVHRNADDGVEFFGGTVNARNLVITGCLDDSIDWTSGWTGKLQFAVVQQYAGGADNGIEADNLSTNQAATPRSKPTLSNVTIIGPADPNEPSDKGLNLRRGTAGNLSSFILLGMNEHALDIDDTETFNNAYSDAPAFLTPSGELTLTTSFLFANALGPFANDAGEPQTDAAFNDDMGSNTLADPGLRDPQNQINPNWLLMPGAEALTGGITPGDPFFTPVPYIGAFNDTDDWTRNSSGGRWITTAQN